MKCNVIWWWRGGEQAGEWIQSLPGLDPDAECAEIERGGRVCVKGLLSVGPPEGPPSRERIAAVLRPWRRTDEAADRAKDERATGADWVQRERGRDLDDETEVGQ